MAWSPLWYPASELCTCPSPQLPSALAPVLSQEDSLLRKVENIFNTGPKTGVSPPQAAVLLIRRLPASPLSARALGGDGPPSESERPLAGVHSLPTQLQGAWGRGGAHSLPSFLSLLVGPECLQDSQHLSDGAGVRLTGGETLEKGEQLMEKVERTVVSFPTWGHGDAV